MGNPYDSRALKPYFHFNVQCTWFLIFWPQIQWGNIFLPSSFMGSPYAWYAVSMWKPYFYFNVQCTWPLTFFFTPNSIGNIFLPWVVYMCDMVTLGEKSNILEPRKRISTLMSSALDLWTPKSIGNIFLPGIVYMCDMVILGGKDDILEPWKPISTLMSSALDLCPFDLKINRKHIPPIVSLYVWHGDW
jgi:hypothetical protein